MKLRDRRRRGKGVGKKSAGEGKQLAGSGADRGKSRAPSSVDATLLMGFCRPSPGPVLLNADWSRLIYLYTSAAAAPPYCKLLTSACLRSSRLTSCPPRTRAAGLLSGRVISVEGLRSPSVHRLLQLAVAGSRNPPFSVLTHLASTSGLRKAERG